MIKYGDCIIRNEKGEVLLLQRSYQDDFEPGKWCLPGGKIEAGESPLQGASRELYEETNLKCLLEGPIHKEERSGNVSYYFQGSAHTFDPTLLDNNEHYRIQWVPIDEIADYDLILDLKDILANKIKMPIFDMKMMEIAVVNIEDLMKRQVLTEASFDKGEISTEDYFNVMEIMRNYAATLIEIDPNRKSPNNYEERLKKLKARRDPDGIEKSHQDELEKATKTKAFIGEIREFGGRKHIRTISGWKYYGKGTGDKAKEHKETHKTTETTTVVERTGKDEKDLSGFSTAELEGMLKIMSDGEEGTEGGARLSAELERRAASASKVKLEDLKLSEGVSAGGSGGAMLVSSKDGRKFIVKKAAGAGDKKNSPKQLEGEYLTDSIYSKLGVPTMLGEMITDSKGTYKVTPFLEGAKDLGSISDYDLHESVRKELQKNFVLDCLLLNWDVIGAGKDNVIVKDGVPYRIDNGGSLLFRAKAGKKGADSLTAKISEIEVMRDSKNPSGKEIYGDLSDEDIVKQAKEVYAKGDVILAAIASSSASDKGEIHKLISQRLEWLKTTYLTEEKPGMKTTKGKAGNVTAGWIDSFKEYDFKGNPEIKEGIIKQIQKIEKDKEHRYKEYASKNGMSVDEYKAALQTKIERMMSKAQPFRATDLGVLDLILHDSKRFKSQFETGTSHGALSPSSRARAEHAFFAFPENAKHDKENRPIYGYASDNPNGVHNTKGSHPPATRATSYGDCIVKIKESTRNRITFCFDDSLSEANTLACTPIDKPHFTSFDINSGDPLKMSEDIASFDQGSYLELQYHQKLTVDDIESIHLSPGNFGGFESSTAYEKMTKAIEKIRQRDNNIKIVVYGNK